MYIYKLINRIKFSLFNLSFHQVNIPNCNLKCSIIRARFVYNYEDLTARYTYLRYFILLSQ